MNKRALMLTAATAALLSGPAFAQCTIDTRTTAPQETAACPGTITITTAGSVVVSTNPPTGPAVTIDGNGSGGAADVINEGTISYIGVGSTTTPMTGIEMVAGNTGGLDNDGKIDFTGVGTNKTGILFQLGTQSASNVFLGDITQTSGGQTLSDLFGGIASWTFDAPNPAAVLLESGSTFKVQGDNSIGINVIAGANLGTTGHRSDIDIIGAIEMTPSSSSSLDSASSAIEIGGTMTGNINVLPGGIISVEGNGSSNGIYLVPANTGTGALAGVLNGDINIDGDVNMTPINIKSLTSTGDSALLIGGTMNGNLNIGTGGVVSAVGEGSEALVITGTINGAVNNEGVLESLGTTSGSPTGGNPQAGSAIFIAGDVTGGIFNDGPIGGNTQNPANISALGGAPAINISPSSDATAGLNIGGYTDNGDTASLLNRGTIGAGSENADVSTTAIEIGGTSAFPVDLVDGILNSGSISSSAFTDTKGGTGTTTIALLISGYADIGPGPGGAIDNTDENPTRPGLISASISGEAGGEAIAIEIDPNGDVPSIINSGSIVASASTTNTDLTNQAVKAIAIVDSSGTLTSITNNSGAFIEALATTLSDNSQVTTAIDVEANTTGFTLTNNGTILGDIYLGSGSDIVDVAGLSPDKPAAIDGTMYFGGNSGADDSLFIGQNGTVVGQIYAGPSGNPTAGEVDITVSGGGTLDLLTKASQSTISSNPGLVEGTTLIAGDFSVDEKSFLDIHYSQSFNTDFFSNAVIINAEKEATLSDNATVIFTPDSFIAPPLGVASATFVALEAPLNDLNISANELGIIQTKFTQNLSYLYSPLLSNVNVVDTTTEEELVLTLTPKTIGADGCKTQIELNSCNLNHIPLFGYAATMFPYVNVALGNDNPLGAAVINGVTNSFNAQQTYEDFAPDVSGAIRADAISLTDEATNVVAARQRALRQYANQDGDLTLWGQQFVQRLNQDSTGVGPGYTDSGFGFAAGLDEGDPVDGRYGAAFTFFSGDTREKQPRDTKTTSEWYMLTGYTDWRGKGLFLDTQLNAGYLNLTGDRYLQLEEPTGTGTFTTYSRDAYDQRPGELASIGATTGAIFDEGGTVFTPQLSLDGLVMRQEAYSEGGGGNGFDLHVASSYAQSMRGFAGLGVRQDFDFTDFLLQPDILAGYRYDFANGAESLKANFESVDPQQIFEVTGPKPDKGNAVASGGVTVSTGAWSLGLSFDYLKAGSGNTSESGTLTLVGRI